MNFNISQSPEYQLQASFTDELINLYGIPIKLIITEKQHFDSNVFGDFQTIKANREDIFDLYALPENSEEYDDIGINFSEFGMLNTETIRLFISKISLLKLSDNYDRTAEDDMGTYNGYWTDDFDHSNLDTAPIMSLQSNLVALPNNRLMEITDVQFMVPGVNNLFTEKDVKNVYKITLKTYDKKLNDNIEAINSDDLQNNKLEADLVGSYKELGDYFDELLENKDEIDTEAKDNINITTDKVVVDTADSVFGRF